MRHNADILTTFSLSRRTPTLANYAKIFTDPAWYGAYLNSIIYVTMNMVISVLRGAAGGLRLLALPASSATSTCSSGS